ncbi:MAG: Na+:solute symporter [Deltaproteobacteria bacterium]|nr:Na+:solute symporter [Deltaproteobacteria bacterium]
MNLHAIDLGIILLYLIVVIMIGILIRKKASQGITNYFLAGKNIPWYVLSVSNASSMFDITGTMWLVTILFIYGFKGTLLPWLWPTFNQVFLMIYLARWIRRSNVLTGAEWIGTRFGNGRGAELSRLSVTIFAIVSVIGFLTYAHQGVGRFAAGVLPFDLEPDTYALILMSITTIYVILGGMYSVVFTDVLQFLILTSVSIIIAVIAMNRISPDMINAVIPEGWKSLMFGWKLNMDWGNLIPEVNNKIAADGYGLFTIVMMMIIFKGILNSMAGTAPNYDMQRVLATRSPKEAAMMSGMVSVALFPRWLMIAGLTFLGLVFFSDGLRDMGAGIDFEMIMPYIIKSDYIPYGVTGLIIAGLLAAFMSTFDSTVNAGAAYIVNDIYKRYINKEADDKSIMRMSYIVSIGIVVLGISFGMLASSIHSVMQWIVSGLGAGFAAPNILKWHWWRFNGYGYFWGMVVGIGSALLTAALFPDMDALYAFPYIIAAAGLVSVIGSLLTEADEEDVLVEFYRTVRPWGFWGPVKEKVLKTYPDFVVESSAARDLLNVFIGVIWQMTFVLVPILLVMKSFTWMSVAIGIMVVTSIFLKKNWYERLGNDVGN